MQEGLGDHILLLRLYQVGAGGDVWWGWVRDWLVGCVRLERRQEDAADGLPRSNDRQ